EGIDIDGVRRCDVACKEHGQRADVVVRYLDQVAGQGAGDQNSAQSSRGTNAERRRVPGRGDLTNDERHAEQRILKDLDPEIPAVTDIDVVIGDSDGGRRVELPVATAEFAPHAPENAGPVIHLHPVVAAVG